MNWIFKLQTNPLLLDTGPAADPRRPAPPLKLLSHTEVCVLNGTQVSNPIPPRPLREVTLSHESSKSFVPCGSGRNVCETFFISFAFDRIRGTQVGCSFKTYVCKVSRLSKNCLVHHHPRAGAGIGFCFFLLVRDVQERFHV